MDGAANQGRDAFSDATLVDAFDALPGDLHSRVKAELEPGERLLWADRSTPPFQGTGFVFYAFCAFAFLMLALGLIGMSRGLTRQPVHDGNEMVAGMAFTGFAFAIMLGVIGNWRSRSRERERAAHVFYAITDRRAIMWTPEPNGNAIRIRTIPNGQVFNLTRVENPDGSGSVFFSNAKNEPPLYTEAQAYPFGFRDIADARRVELLVRNNLMGSEHTA